jgi:hypothetical protein
MGGDYFVSRNFPGRLFTTPGFEGIIPGYPHKSPSGLVYFSGIFIPKRYEDMWGFGVHPILSNPLKYSSQKKLYHDVEFLI